MRLAVGLLTVGLGLSACWSPIWQESTGAPVISRGLEGDSWNALSEDFTSRLREKYPSGTPRQSLISDLSRDGFEIESPSTHTNKRTEEDRPVEPAQDFLPYVGESEASYTWATVACLMSAWVFWTEDEVGRVEDIRGVYREAGCF